MKPEVLKGHSKLDGSEFVDMFTFKSGDTVPIYEVLTTGGLNQIIGYAKFLNSCYGNVYYRGVGGIYDNVLPSLMRNRVNRRADDLNKIITSVHNDKRLFKSLKLRDLITPTSTDDIIANKRTTRYNRYCIEAVMQHYAGVTRFLDVVDNHWVAIWMGLHKFISRGKRGEFCKCERRRISLGNIYENISASVPLDDDAFLYLLLIGMPYPKITPKYGITETDLFVEVDLRKALPSIYLRPHAQHALVVRKREKNVKTAQDYDMSSQVIGILKIRVDRADEWISEGSLLTDDNLFPSPSIDHGYDVLLQRNDIFAWPFEIVKYF